MMGRVTGEMLGAIKLLESEGYTVMRCKPGTLAPYEQEEADCAVTLFRSLREREGRYVAANADGPLNWSIIEPRTQEALLAALETDGDAEFDYVCQQEADERSDEAELYRVTALNSNSRRRGEGD